MTPKDLCPLFLLLYYLLYIFFIYYFIIMYMFRFRNMACSVFGTWYAPFSEHAQPGFGRLPIEPRGQRAVLLTPILCGERRVAEGGDPYKMFLVRLS